MHSQRVIGHTREQKRRNQRVLVPTIAVLIEEGVFHSVDWSLGGLLLGDYRGSLREGDRLKVVGAGPADDDLSKLGAPARVVRRDGDKLALEFLDLPGRAFDVLQAMLMHRHPPASTALRGRYT